MVTKFGHAASDISGAADRIVSKRLDVAGSIKALRAAASPSSDSTLAQLLEIPQNAPEVKHLSKSVGSVLYEEALEEGRAQSFAHRLINMIPGVTEKTLEMGHLGIITGYGRAETFGATSFYGGRLVSRTNELLDGVIIKDSPSNPRFDHPLLGDVQRSLSEMEIQLGSTKSFNAPLISKMVESHSAQASVAYNLSIRKATHASPMREGLTSAILDDLDYDQVVLGHPIKDIMNRLNKSNVHLNSAYISHAQGLAPPNATQAILNVAPPSSIKGAISQLSEASRTSAKVVSSEKKAVQTVGKKVAVMGRRTLDMLIQAGEAAARIMR